MAKAKEQFEEPGVGETSDDAVGELEGQTDDPDAPNYVDPSVEYVEGEEPTGDDQSTQKVALGLHPFGVQIQVTARDGSKAMAILNMEEAHNLAGSLLDLTAFHTMMGIQQQMAEQAAIAEMMARGGQPPERRTKSGIIIK